MLIRSFHISFANIIYYFLVSEVCKAINKTGKIIKYSGNIESR